MECYKLNELIGQIRSIDEVSDGEGSPDEPIGQKESSKWIKELAGSAYDSVELVSQTDVSLPNLKEASLIKDSIDHLFQEIVVDNDYRELINLKIKVQKDIIEHENQTRTLIAEMKVDLDEFGKFGASLSNEAKSIEESINARKDELNEHVAENGKIQNQIGQMMIECQQTASDLLGEQNTLSMEDSLTAAKHLVSSKRSLLEREMKIADHKQNLLNDLEEQRKCLRKSFDLFDKISSDVIHLKELIKEGGQLQKERSKREVIKQKFDREANQLVERMVEVGAIDHSLSNNNVSLITLKQHLEHAKQLLLFKRQTITSETAQITESIEKNEKLLKQKQLDNEQAAIERQTQSDSLEAEKQRLSNAIEQFDCQSESNDQQELIELRRNVDQLRFEVNQEIQHCEQLRESLNQVADADLVELERRQTYSKERPNKLNLISKNIYKLGDLEKQFGVDKAFKEQFDILRHISNEMKRLGEAHNSFQQLRDRAMFKKKTGDEQRVAHEKFAFQQQQERADVEREHRSKENEKNDLLEGSDSEQDNFDDSMMARTNVTTLATLKRTWSEVEPETPSNVRKLRSLRDITPNKQILTPTVSSIVSSRSSNRATPRKRNSIVDSYTKMMREMNSRR